MSENLPSPVLVTGGAGFIGSAVVRTLLERRCSVVNVDKLTYASSLESLAVAETNPCYHFEQHDICEVDEMNRIFAKYRPAAVIHLAAESHVDRSIENARPFIDTNVVGTTVLLDAALAFWSTLDREAREGFRFLHVSTDEVYGSLSPEGFFTEVSPVRPNSPYAASKAAADHMVRAWHRTYGLPTLISNCSNNYGPYQFPEKMIPLMILAGMNGRQLPVYGIGDNERDWLFVEDHVAALLLILERGEVGAVYNVGGGAVRTNIDVVRDICRLLDERFPESSHFPHESLISFVLDRPGHDKRYAIDSSKLRTQLGWEPALDFARGLSMTLDWYVANESWWQGIQARAYDGERLGGGRRPDE